MEIAVIIASILFQLVAVGVAIYLIFVTERYFAWILIALAISLMAIRRVITLIAIFKGTIEGSSVTLAEYTALIISIFLSAGLYFMIPIFKSIRNNQRELDIKNKQLQVSKDRAEQSEAFLENLFDNIPSMVFIKDAKDLKFIRVNKAAEALLGYARHELIGRSDYDLFPENQASFFTSKDRSVFESDDILVVEEELIDTRNGPKILYTKKIAVRDSSGNGKFLIGISEDITQKKANEQALLKAKEKAEESDRLKSAFLQNMSHEIRTPLNAVCGFSEKINSPNLTPEKRKQYSKFIVDNSLQLLSVVTNILTISSLETGQERVFRSEVNVNDLLRELEGSHSLKLKLRGDVQLRVGKWLPMDSAIIGTDKAKLHQILSNLLGNAIKFTQKGIVEFGCVLQADTIEFYVSDSGIGIEEGKQHRIFKRFAQADLTIQHSYGGTGLGLPICKGLVELLGGKIWLESKVGIGSTFYFTIPNQKLALAHEQEVVVEKAKCSLEGYIILVAEDEEFNLVYLRELLSEKRCKVITVTNGRQAVDICRENESIDLVLMDIRMPVMDGLTAAKLIKGIRPKLPIVAQTAYALEHEVAIYCKAFDSYLVKPIKVVQVLDVLSKLLDGPR
jgi:PAS domain S-box-containing protein